MFDFARWLGSTPLSLAIKTAGVLPQLLQVVHLLTIGVVLASVLMLVLRIHGRAYAEEPLERVWRRFGRWFWWGIGSQAITGVLMAIGEPLREVSSLSFWIKMVLVAVGVLGMRSLHRSSLLAAGEPLPVAARHTAKILVVVWLSIVLLGRGIGYDTALWGALSPRAHL